MSSEPDLVQRYLDELAERLHGSAASCRRVLLETEAHLLEAVDAEVAAGADLATARSVAVQRFGSPATVAEAVDAAAWRRLRPAAARAAARTLLQLAAAGLLALGVVGVVARLVAAATSTAAVYGFPVAVTPPASSCPHWLALHPGAASCRQAATAEASADLTLALLAAGVLGLGLAAVLALHGRTRRPVVLMPAVGRALGAVLFGLGSVVAAVLAASDAVLLSSWGKGLYWTAAAVFAVASVIGLEALRRSLGPSSGLTVTQDDAAPRSS